MPFLELMDVSVRLGAAAILKNITFFVKRGELAALIGPNGAGKTTLLRAVAGLAPYQGEIRLGGVSLSVLAAQARAKKLSYLPQGHMIHWPMAVADIVALGRLPHRSSIMRLTAPDETIIAAAIEAADLQELRHRRIDTLSQGEKARVMIARALAAQAPLLLADEPTAALDPYHQLHIMELLRAEAQKGAAVIAVLHDLTLAAQFADRVILLSGGIIAAQGAPGNVLSPENLETVYRIRRMDAPPHAQDLGPVWMRVDNRSD